MLGIIITMKNYIDGTTRLENQKFINRNEIVLEKNS